MTPFFLVSAALLATPLVFLIAQRWNAALIALAPASLFCGFLSLLPAVLSSGAIVQQVQWIPSLDISLSFRVDGLALLFALLITGIGAFIFLYASSYLSSNWRTPRFFAALNVFMASMLGAVLSDDLLGLVVFWELTSLSSFILIGYDPAKAASRRSAQQGLLITVAGGLAMLAGFVLLGAVAGSYKISEIISSDLGSALQGPLGTAIVVLIAVGAFSKSAQFPLHSWLPNAMVAPTPVSAYLHSATMVKLGVYLLARLSPALSEVDIWTPLLLTTGALTMLCGSVLALRETDLKLMLAYTTIVSLGTLIALIGIDHPAASTALVTFLLVHALYKASLFMVAGIIDHATGTRDSSILGGLAACMPITALIASVAALSMAGIPPLLGFIGKELIYEAAWSARIPFLIFAVIVLANACMVVIAGLIALRCFFGARTEVIGKAVQDPLVGMWIGPLVLALAALAFGLMPQRIQGLLSASAASVQGQWIDVELSLWHGFTPLLALSLITLCMGVGIFLNWRRIRGTLKALGFIDRWGPDALYDKALDGLVQFASWQTRLIQTGSLRHYMAMSVGIVAVVVLVSMLAQDALVAPSFHLRDAGMDFVLPALLIGACWMVLYSRSFVQGIVSAGTVGFGVAVVFLLGGAPDLAFTQFSVEALSVVILLAVIGRMPFRASDPRSTSQRGRDAVIAVAFGAMFMAVMFSVIAVPFDGTVSDFFRESSYPLAHGRNLVNVIIVDFRALDTLGEITVLAVAALAAVAVFFSTTTSGRARISGAPAKGSKAP